MTTNTQNKVLSANGELTYTDGHPFALCQVCEEEETDIRWGMGGIPVANQPICIYCANQRKDAYKPVSYLGAS